jgi:dolichyl-phosphate beta-glucosyltransferase
VSVASCKLQTNAGGEEIGLSVVIPAYNEEENIGPSVRALEAFLQGTSVPHEIIVVDDGSQDATAEHATRLAAAGLPIVLLRSERNFGKGHAVRTGMLAVRGRYVVFMDADLSYPVEDIEGLLTLLKEGYDLVIGSRALPESNMLVRPPLRRYLAGRVYSLLVQIVLMRGIPDTQCGFKGFKREVANDLFSRLTLDGFAFDVELLFLARKRGYRIKTIPVSLTFAQKSSKVRLFADSLHMLLDLLRIRLNDIRGFYARWIPD